MPAAITGVNPRWLQQAQANAKRADEIARYRSNHELCMAALSRFAAENGRELVWRLS